MGGVRGGGGVNLVFGGSKLNCFGTKSIFFGTKLNCLGSNFGDVNWLVKISINQL